MWSTSCLRPEDSSVIPLEDMNRRISRVSNSEHLDLSSRRVILSAHYRLELFERHFRLNMAEKESAGVSFKDINE